MSNYYSDRRDEEDSTIQYHGLINQGATCYLNSVLQVLFMTKDFRKAVQRNACGDHIDVQLASLFNDLKTKTAKTVKVTNKLGIHRVCEQRDAAEHFEKILSDSSPEAAKIFRGNLTHKTICSKCSTETDEDAPFWDLPLALVKICGESYSVEDGIQEFFRDSDFTGENQMYCDICDAKCDATTKCVMKRHPEVLMLLLKRFEFSYHQMSFVKNSCTVDVPSVLKIPENQMYELYAFVEHFGSLTGGHYTATIKSQDNKNSWYYFNDSSVTLLNNQPFQRQKTERTKTAYLLFYRKKGIQDNTEASNKRPSDRDAKKRKAPFDDSGNDVTKLKKEEERKKDNDDEGIGRKTADYQTERTKDGFAKDKPNDSFYAHDLPNTEGSNKRRSDRDAVKRKVPFDEPGDDVTKQKKEEERKKDYDDEGIGRKTADYQTERTKDAFAKDKRNDSFYAHDLPNKHEQQGNRKMNVGRMADAEQMTRENKHPLRDGVHDQQNKPNKSQDDNRERNTSRGKLSESQQKQNRSRTMSDYDDERMGGKVQDNGQTDSGKCKMNRKGEVTDSHGETGHRKGGHEDAITEKKKKTNAGGSAARNDVQLQKQSIGSVETQKDKTGRKSSKYRGNKEDDEHNRISVEPSPQAESGKTGMQTQEAGSEEMSDAGNPQPKKKKKIRSLFKKFRKNSKRGFDESKQSAKERKNGAGESLVTQDDSRDKETEKTPGCFSFSFSLKKRKTKKQKT